MNANNNETAIDQCSLYSVYIEVIVEDKTNNTNDLIIAKATGFIFEESHSFYLVSNWHVFSGRNPESFEPLDKNNSALPEKLRVYFPIEGKLGETDVVDYPLRKENDNTYNWLEHQNRNKVDVALLPIDIKSEYAIYPLNTINQSRGIDYFPNEFYVGQEVFILGYPLGIKGGGGFPIWKRATIAIEPYLSIDESELKILVDTATREGMSGSPVIAVSFPDSKVLFDGRKQPVYIRPSKLFLGVYSGRILGEDEFSAQLGVVWKEQAIREVIEYGAPYREQ
jgi:hypothetical protein